MPAGFWCCLHLYSASSACINQAGSVVIKATLTLPSEAERSSVAARLAPLSDASAASEALQVPVEAVGDAATSLARSLPLPPSLPPPVRPISPRAPPPALVQTEQSEDNPAAVGNEGVPLPPEAVAVLVLTATAAAFACAACVLMHFRAHVIRKHQARA